MKTMKKIIFMCFTALLIVACSSDDDNTQSEYVPAAFAKGILITNEGPFNNGSGTITYVSDDYSTVAQNIYRNVNGSALGNIVQSMGFNGDNAYIVVSNSQKIVIANRYTFESVDSITTGLDNPRYFVSVSGNKGYVSNWGDPNNNADDYVAVLDLRNNSISATIPVSFGPERILAANNKVYVAHQGGYGQNNLISVISGNSVESTITVGDVPNSMVVSGNNLYVLCGGNPSYTGAETAGSLVKVDIATGQVSQTFSFGSTEHPSSLTLDGTNLFYNLDGKVYKVDTTSISLPGADIIDGNFYTLQAKEGKLYAADAKDFASKGSLVIYDLSNNQQIQDFQTGIVPGGIYFNE
jgi:major membrane immunogen (membrane-anchored lipoprotein)